MKRTFREALFVLTRAGTAGIQRFPQHFGTGDVFRIWNLIRPYSRSFKYRIVGHNNVNFRYRRIYFYQNASCPYNLYHNNQADHGLLLNVDAV